jgi:hypothetical protein
MYMQTSLHNHGQALIASEYLETLLREGKAPPLETLLELVPDEPLAPPHEVKDLGWVQCDNDERKNWLREAEELHAKYPGYQDRDWKLEEMSWDNHPTDGAPLIEFVRALISFLKADWCLFILNYEDARQQFREWLPGYLDVGPRWLRQEWPVWWLKPGWAEALQILRIACGLPRFAPTWRDK